MPEKERWLCNFLHVYIVFGLMLTMQGLHGAGKVVAYCTHPVLSGRALENLNSSTLDELVVTDTIPLSLEMRNCVKIRQLSMANLLAEAMRRVSNEESISAMFT